jgi:hypothetical protein
LYLGLHCFWYAFQNFVVDQVLFHGFRCDYHGFGSVIVVALCIISMKELTLINRYHQTQERPKPPVE